MAGQTLLYLNVADELRQRIISGELSPGTRLPSRAELAAHYEVSEQVVRRAIDVLTAEGLLYTRTGARPTVRQRPAITRLTRSWYQESRGGSPFRADVAAQGHSGDWECRSRRDRATPTIAERLAVQPGEAVMRSEYVFRADGRPMMLSTSYEPLALTEGTPVMLPEEGPHAGRGVRERMAVIGQEITHVSEVVTARPATAAEATQLGVGAGTLVMVIERTYHAREYRVETADIIVPTDRYALQYIIPVNG